MNWRKGLSLGIVFIVVISGIAYGEQLPFLSYELYTGTAKFQNTEVTIEDNSYTFEFPDLPMMNSFDWGVRFTSLWKFRHFSTGMICGDIEIYKLHPELDSMFWEIDEVYEKGMLVFQDGFGPILSIPLGIFRAYSSYEIVVSKSDIPVVTFGYKFILGGRLLISDHFHIFVENRSSDVFIHPKYKVILEDYNEQIITFQDVRNNCLVFGVAFEFIAPKPQK